MRPFLALLALAVLCLGLQVQPETVTAPGTAGADFEQVFTIINNEPRPLTLDIVPDEYSRYLADAFTLSEERITLLPQQSGNVQVRGTIPPLGPEVHRLVYTLRNGDSTLGSLVVRIPMEGVPTLHPKVSIEVQDVVEDAPVSVVASLYNFGNVIAYYNLTLSVRERDTPIGSIRYPRAVQVLPGAQEQIVLLYTEKLDPGEYLVEVHGRVNAERDERATQPFRVILPEQHRTLAAGEDLVLRLKRYGDVPRVEYVVRRDGREVLRDTHMLQSDELIVPTGLLEPGSYDVLVRSTHGQGTDIHTVTLDISQRRLLALPHIAALLVCGLAALLLAAPLRIRLRIFLLSWRVSRQEKRLKALVERAHRLAHDS